MTSKAVKLWDLVCDADGCDLSYRGEGGQSPDVVRYRAALEGWSFIYNVTSKGTPITKSMKDECPVHVGNVKPDVLAHGRSGWAVKS